MLKSCNILSQDFPNACGCDVKVNSLKAMLLQISDWLTHEDMHFVYLPFINIILLNYNTNMIKRESLTVFRLMAQMNQAHSLRHVFEGDDYI